MEIFVDSVRRMPLTMMEYMRNWHKTRTEGVYLHNMSELPHAIETIPVCELGPPAFKFGRVEMDMVRTLDGYDGPFCKMQPGHGPLCRVEKITTTVEKKVCNETCLCVGNAEAVVKLGAGAG